VLREDPWSKQAFALPPGAMAAGDLGEAEKDLRQALAIDPSFTLAHTKLGEVLQRQGRDDEAVQSFERTVAIAPLSPVEFNAIGNLHRRHGRIDRAIDAYRDALRADPQYIGAYNNLGLCLQERGRLDEAEELYAKALVIRPENPILRNSRATLLAARGDRIGALAEVDRALAANPNWPVGLGNRATLLFEMGRIPEAKEAFVLWVAAEPDTVEGRLGHALTLWAGDGPAPRPSSRGPRARSANLEGPMPAWRNAAVCRGGGAPEDATKNRSRAWNQPSRFILRRGAAAARFAVARRSAGGRSDGLRRGCGGGGRREGRRRRSGISRRRNERLTPPACCRRIGEIGSSPSSEVGDQAVPGAAGIQEAPTASTTTRADRVVIRRDVVVARGRDCSTPVRSPRRRCPAERAINPQAVADTESNRRPPDAVGIRLDARRTVL
jgi:Flp pilus assembly protein TadD